MTMIISWPSPQTPNTSHTSPPWPLPGWWSRSRWFSSLSSPCSQDHRYPSCEQIQAGLGSVPGFFLWLQNSFAIAVASKWWYESEALDFAIIILLSIGYLKDHHRTQGIQLSSRWKTKSKPAKSKTQVIIQAFNLRRFKIKRRRQYLPIGACQCSSIGHWTPGTQHYVHISFMNIFIDSKSQRKDKPGINSWKRAGHRSRPRWQLTIHLVNIKICVICIQISINIRPYQSSCSS